MILSNVELLLLLLFCYLTNVSVWPQFHGKDNLIFTTSYQPSFSPKPRGRRTPERAQYSRRDNPTDRRWHRRSRQERSSSEEEQNSEEEQEKLELLQKRRPKHRTEPVVAGRRHRKLQHRTDGCVAVNTLFPRCICAPFLQFCLQLMTCIAIDECSLSASLI